MNEKRAKKMTETILSLRPSIMTPWTNRPVLAQVLSLYEEGVLQCNGQCMTWESHLSTVSCPVHEVIHSRAAALDEFFTTIEKNGR